MGNAYCPIHGTVSDLHDCRPLGQRQRSYEPVGIGLRERIATAALQGMMCRTEAFDNPDKAAKWAVEFADALIVELYKSPENAEGA